MNGPAPTDDAFAHTLLVQQLFVRHQESLLSYVLSLEPNLADAQDILQTVFLTVTRKADTWAGGTDFLAWACTVARYDTLHFQRTRARGPGHLAADVMELVHGDDQFDQQEYEKRVAILQRCLDKLAPRARELVMRRYHSGEMPAQIAAAVGWTANAVRVGLSRARRTLRECLDRNLSRPSLEIRRP